MTRDGQHARFTGHSRFTTADGEILRHPGDCPGNPPEQVNRKPRVDAAADAAELERRREAKREMRRQIMAHRRKQSGDEP